MSREGKIMKMVLNEYNLGNTGGVQGLMHKWKEYKIRNRHASQGTFSALLLGTKQDLADTFQQKGLNSFLHNLEMLKYIPNQYFILGTPKNQYFFLVSISKILTSEVITKIILEYSCHSFKCLKINWSKTLN